ncbi:hypothetical protein DICPUDRAFT_53766 [Dictyostelium purpureum]|uniref:HAD family hydrolase n=1 Tax=Dictyostelium purpureum TaxID=5786 RepID=F0ZE50_DICPU|nr:uncharacterized protein DICPUDRAFT_53766 [Dictyostelium purpureum]EGC37787.1 hypothetical protein DICPUDRAFT_53766 [Dictyostelium purpureum]|eukprot:XP_003285726.1 hypothetical protein DICPUDRAFT_53766 [Dictyostelium purpureum]
MNSLLRYKSIKRPIRLIIFDLDGTLTVPVMDFKKLKQDLGFPTGQDVLEVIKGLNVEEKTRANKIIHEFELEARNNLIIQENTEKLLLFLESNNIPKAIHSRNSLENIKYFIDKVNFNFHHFVGREIEPPKPMANGSLEILRVLNQSYQDNPITPNQVIFVGDSVDDIKTSKNLGALACLLKNEYNKHHSHLADIEIDNLIELQDIISHFNDLN